VKKVPPPKVVSSAQASEMPLPAQIQEALGELVGPRQHLSPGGQITSRHRNVKAARKLTPLRRSKIGVLLKARG
jgi:hypothetical protein